jgi:hypothetical protein
MIDISPHTWRKLGEDRALRLVERDADMSQTWGRISRGGEHARELLPWHVREGGRGGRETHICTTQTSWCGEDHDGGLFQALRRESADI